MTEQAPPENPPYDYHRMVSKFMKSIKHGQVLGLELLEARKDGITIRLPYNAEIVGNPYTGVIHGGAITALLDQACGMAVAAAIAPELDITPTIDLRIDYMRPAEPHREVLAFTHVYRVTKSVVFARGVAYQEDINKPIAHCVATFIRMGMKEGYLGGKKKQEGAA